jgi:hypothetical protein
VIPNRCMFIFLKPMSFSLVNYLAVRSAAAVNQPDEVHLYCEELPSGRWWEKARPYVTEVTKIEPPRVVGGVPVEHPAHKADLVRLDLLLRDGGVYLDLDVLCVKPFAPLLRESFVLGQEGEDGYEGVCNGVILAEPGAAFAKEWLAGFDPRTSRWQGFRARGHDENWNEMSVRYPAHLARLFPESVTIAPYDNFHWPTWRDEHLDWFFRGNGDEFPNSYCHHLWQATSWDRYLKDLTPEYIKNVDTNFTVRARRFID